MDDDEDEDDYGFDDDDDDDDERVSGLFGSKKKTKIRALAALTNKHGR